MNKFLPVFLFLFLFGFSASAQDPAPELRGTWFTTAWRIDWPPVGNAQTQKNQMVNMFNRLQAANINAVFFQVRPNADAFYRSNYEPWSHFLGASTADRGKDPGYDPLAFAIEEAHKRGMELHVWLNPYRYENTAGEFAGRPGDYAQTHPHLIITYNGKTYFDPGHPQTTQLIKNIVADIVQHYNIDGVIFDDYFYPSNMPNEFDDHTYHQFGSVDFIRRYYTDITRGNFRRASVNNMIKEVNDTIKAINPALVFGVSPAGIYTTNLAVASFYGTTLPAGITGNNNWATINCDPLAWLKEGSVDYISPQLYWQLGGSQDFKTLTEWWGLQAKRYGRHHYPSLGSYRLYGTKSMDAETSLEQEFRVGEWMLDNEKSGWAVTEIENQILANRNSPNNEAQGLIFYNTVSLLNTSKNLATYLAEGVFEQKSIWPYLSWLANPALTTPQILDMASLGGETNLAVMNIQGAADRYLLYGSSSPVKNTQMDFVQVVFGKSMAAFQPGTHTSFAVAEFHRNRKTGSLSAAQNYTPLNAANITALLGGQICKDHIFSWTIVSGVSQYQLVVLDAETSARIQYASPVVNATQIALADGYLEGQQTYAFRIKALDGTKASYSTVGSFSTAYPASGRLNTPEANALDVPLSLTFQWTPLTGATSYDLQVATDPEFSAGSIVEQRNNLTQNIAYLTLEQGRTKHYARIRGHNSCGSGLWGPVTAFTTTSGVGVDAITRVQAKIYPNPVKDQGQLIYPYTLGKRSIRIFDMNGRLVLEHANAQIADSDLLDLSSLSRGFYTGQVISQDNPVMIFKLVKSE